MAFQHGAVTAIAVKRKRFTAIAFSSKSPVPWRALLSFICSIIPQTYGMPLRGRGLHIVSFLPCTLPLYHMAQGRFAPLSRFHPCAHVFLLGSPQGRKDGAKHYEKHHERKHKQSNAQGSISAGRVPLRPLRQHRRLADSSCQATRQRRLKSPNESHHPMLAVSCRRSWLNHSGRIRRYGLAQSHR